MKREETIKRRQGSGKRICLNAQGLGDAVSLLLLCWWLFLCTSMHLSSIAILRGLSVCVPLQDMLVKDASLRQAVSELGLKIAERFHLDNIGQAGHNSSAANHPICRIPFAWGRLLVHVGMHLGYLGRQRRTSFNAQSLMLRFHKYTTIRRGG